MCEHAPRGTKTFNSFKTNTYKLHFFESASGFMLVLNTDHSVDTLTDDLRYIYSEVRAHADVMVLLGRSFSSCSLGVRSCRFCAAGAGTLHSGQNTIATCFFHECKFACVYVFMLVCVSDGMCVYVCFCARARAHTS